MTTTPTSTDESAERAISGRHAVITGATRGIGQAIASDLARLGADVSLMGRDVARLKANAVELRERFGVRAQAVPVDLSQPASIVDAFAVAVKSLGAPAILVNNAGMAHAGPVLRTGLDKWNEVMAVDLTAPFLCIQQVLKSMTIAGYGRIVNVASTAGLTGYGYVSAYCAAKHGVIGLTRSLAIELAKSGVTVNAVCPGYTDTDIVKSAIANIVTKTGRSQDEALAELVSHNPQGRLIRPEEVAAAVIYLCQPGSASITGQSMVIAGGELM
jgi:NAD(P)-dependent dehydrogenase (short-subunit alcohol dehydrogenase family)